MVSCIGSYLPKKTRAILFLSLQAGHFNCFLHQLKHLLCSIATSHCLSSCYTYSLETSVCGQGYQTDWEAILSSKVGDFVASVSAWMLPREARPPTAPQMVTTAAATLAAAGSDAAAADSNTAAAVSDATVAEGASVGDAGDAVNGSGGGSGAINGHGGGAGSSPAEAPPAVHGARPPPLETLPEVLPQSFSLRHVEDFHVLPQQ